LPPPPGKNSADAHDPSGYICLPEGVCLLYICNKLTLRHKNGVYLYSSEILKIILKIQQGVHGQRKVVNPCSKLGLLGKFGRMHGLLSCEICFFVYCVIMRVADHVSRRYLYARTRLPLWLAKAR